MMSLPGLATSPSSLAFALFPESSARKSCPPRRRTVSRCSRSCRRLPFDVGVSSEVPCRDNEPFSHHLHPLSIIVLKLEMEISSTSTSGVCDSNDRRHVVRPDLDAEPGAKLKVRKLFLQLFDLIGHGGFVALGFRSRANEFVIHYHGERAHQGMNHQILFPGPEANQQKVEVVCRERLGGVLKYYHRQAA